MTELPDGRLVLDGQLVDVARTFSTFDPSTGQELAAIHAGGPDEIDAAVQAARAAQRSWSRRDPVDRGRLLHRVASIIRGSSARLAEVESLDTGKPLAQATADVEAAAHYFEYYGGLAATMHGESIPVAGADLAVTSREPFGVVGHIVPWNYPLQISARTVAPALAAGNTSVLKPAGEAPLTPLALGAILLDAGVPAGVLNVVPGLGVEAGAALAASDGVDLIAFTGGFEAGRSVMAAAATNVTPLTLELGGKSPNIVLADADLDRAVAAVRTAMIQNAGQTCSAGARLIIDNTVADAFLDKLHAALERVVIGRGIDDPDLGPLIGERQLAAVETALDLARAGGADVVGGRRCHADTGGFFLEPAVVLGAAHSDAIAQEEVFGPVLTVLRCDGPEHAVEIANGTPFALVAGVWTESVHRALELVRDVRAGQVYVNSYGAGGGVRLPFGGFGRSGFGREKGAEALRSFTQTKTAYFRAQGVA